MMDRELETTFYFKFTTRAFATGIPTTLAGTPVISAYEDNSVTQITAGITLTVDLDGVTGLNLVTVVGTAANGFESGKEYAFAITTGTVATVSVVGEVVKEVRILDAGSLPSTQSQVGNLATGSAAISVQSESYTLTTGTQSSGTVSNTETLDNVYHQHTDTAGAMELYYQFDVTGAGVATEVEFNGALTGINDSLTIYAYDWVGAAWDQLGTFDGGVALTYTQEAFSLLNRHTGTGANLGKVRFRFYAASGLTTATLSVDQVFCSYSVVSQSVGYALGSVWGDTTHGVAGTEAYVNGVADNPSLTLADMIAIASGLGLHRFQMSPETTITFGESHTDEVWSGDGWTLAMGGRDVSQSHFYHCNDVSGIGTTPSGEAHILDSHIGAMTLGQCHITRSSFNSTFTAGAAANYFIEDSRSGVAGSGAPTLDFSGNGASSNINARNWFGGGTWVFDADCTASIEVALGGTHTITTGGGDVEFRGNPRALTINTSLTGTTNIIIGNGAPITINGTGGTVNIYGVHNGITDNSTGTTVTDFGQDITAIGALNDLSSADILTQINAALDAAIPELGVGAPTATPSVRLALALLYMATVNKRDTTGSSDEIHNSAGAVVMDAVASDDGVTFSKAKYIAP